MFNTETVARIRFIADENGWNPSSLLAVVEVESAGNFEWDVNGEMLPPIRFEGHYFYKRLRGSVRTEAVNKGLAHSKAGRVKNPRSYEARYDLLHRARAIDSVAALESISMGLGQVMGAWWKDLGYRSVDEMFDRAKSGIAGQVDLMARFIQHNGLSKFITGEPTLKKFAGFALRYNGKGYKKNKYHTKMLAAAKRWANNEGGLNGIRHGAELGLTHDVQKDLKALGYDPGIVDGKMGKKTRAAVTAFQTDNGLVVDGKPGKMTRETLDEELAEKAGKQGDVAIGRGVAVTAPSVAVETMGKNLLDKVTDLQSLGIVSMIMDYLVTGLAVAGISLLCYGFYKKFKSGAGQ